MDFITTLTNISANSFVIPLLAGLIKFKKIDRRFRLLVVLMMVEGLTETAVAIMMSLDYEKYHIAHHLYVLVEYSIFAVLFSSWIKTPVVSKAVKYSIPLVLAASILNSLFLQDLNHLNSYSVSMTQVLYTAMSSYTLYLLLVEDYGNIFRNPVFWAASGLLLFSAGDLAYFAFFPLIKRDFLIAIWIIHAILNIIVHIFYCLGIICKAWQWESRGE